MADLAASTHSFVTCEKWSSRSLNTNPKNCSVSAIVLLERCHDDEEKAWNKMSHDDAVAGLHWFR